MEDGEDEHSLDTMPGNNSSTGSDRDGMSSSSSQETPLLSDFQRVGTLEQQEDEPEDDYDEVGEIKRGLLWRLYISHFLSTWNMRSYEFTVILLFAKAYPNSLLPTSIRGVLTNGATLLLSPSIGRWVDHNAARFHTMKVTILVQRVAIVIGCLIWMLLFASPLPQPSSSHTGSAGGGDEKYHPPSKTFLISVLIFLGVLERICAVANTLVMERDWVPTIASETATTTSAGAGTTTDSPPLYKLNAVMRRIDLISKILAPVFVSVIAIRTAKADDAHSTSDGGGGGLVGFGMMVMTGGGIQSGGAGVYLAAVTALMNLGTVGIELVTARSAWDRCHVLKLGREAKDTLPLGDADTSRGENDDDDGEGSAIGRTDRSSLGDRDNDVRNNEEGTPFLAVPDSSTTSTRGSILGTASSRSTEKKGLELYFSSDVCLASLSAALQSFSVLSLSGPMTTYLLTRHYSLALITTARTCISVIEIASTLLFPLAATFLTRHPLFPSSHSHHHHSSSSSSSSLSSSTINGPIPALGLLGVTLQFLLLIPCFVSLVLLPSASTPESNPATTHPYLTLTIFATLGLSRLGHWTHNMAVQQLVQTEVAPRHRVEFSGVEMTFVSGAEIGRWASAAVWSRPEQFKGVAALGMGSVFVIWGLFCAWVVLGRSGRRGSMWSGRDT